MVELEKFSDTFVMCVFLKTMVENYLSARICNLHISNGQISISNQRVLL